MGYLIKTKIMLEQLQLIHFYAFLGFLLLFWVLEYFFPLRKKVWSTYKRWLHNLWFSIINTLVARFLFIITPIIVAIYAAHNGLWLFNIIGLNFIVEVIISVIILDLIIYLQHLLAHRWKWFWRLHSIHHSDKTLDVTTAVRFHTLEIVLSLFIKMFFILLLWINEISVVIFEIILVSSAIFNHSNLKIPNFLDKILSYIIVTPEFHQVHHSVIKIQTDSNYWFFLSVWDKFFGTYTYHKFKVKEIWLNENKDNLSFKELMLLDINK
jgi:sterol desaturase/sphingolipid hydroxylase (fatty acid hydroxylase superfamily)